MDENKKTAAQDERMQRPVNENKALDRSGTLDDEARVRVLSPGMMVLKRFFRNRLAITGLAILVFMFAFSFLGGMLMPYRQSDVFYKVESTVKEYAGASYAQDLRPVAKEGETFTNRAFSAFIHALNRQSEGFEADGKLYGYEKLGEDFYALNELSVLCRVNHRKVMYAYENVGGFVMPDGMRAAFEAAHKAGQSAFEFDGQRYLITGKTGAMTIAQSRPVAAAVKFALDAFSADDVALTTRYDMAVGAAHALMGGETAFSVDGTAYTAEAEGKTATIYADRNGRKTPVVYASDMILNTISGEHLPVEFKLAARKAIETGQTRLVFPDANGQDVEYRIELMGLTYNIKRSTDTHLIDIHHAPDGKHWLGTDQNGMDVLTRLMYGGRISLLVGFVVVLIEIFIGVVVGGVSGYFGGWVDNALMRFVDLFNSIPFWPIMIITGAVMDTMEINPYLRIFLLMFILGVMGWTGIARVVRGQILALREQDFMVATEASGIRVRRRIFRHLVPNVMPLLIVQGTMSLGSIILTEATLSYLGLGVKYPIASWGSIIHAASNPYIVTNYPNIWMPAGFLILFTVLGFNFVGDGLRDAFDPKMKR